MIKRIFRDIVDGSYLKEWGLWFGWVLGEIECGWVFGERDELKEEDLGV